MYLVRAALLIAALAFPLLSFAGDNQLSDSEKKGGWKLLFDGKSTAGWRNYKKDDISKGWQVKDGALVRADKAAGDIITKDQYEEFELTLEYKISKGGNSGLMFHVVEQNGPPWHSGPEIQVQDNVDGHDPQKAGWLYQLYQPALDPKTSKTIDATKPAGEWNQIHLIISKERSELDMNGVRYWTCKLGSKDWNDKVAKSKFAKLEKFGNQGKGFLCLQDHGNEVAYRNIKIRPLKAGAPAPESVDGKKKVKIDEAFPDLKWADWTGVDDKGKVVPLRPIVITHAGDQSNRIFVAMQQGQIHLLPEGGKSGNSSIFLDISSKVRYEDKENEEGLLGLAFHPNYKNNGELFAYYTTRTKPHHCVISRFRVSKNDKNKADSASEEILLETTHPFWNHKGGTVAFGPDGFLYAAIGDGGSGNDPFQNGQNLSTLLGKIIRIDVNKKDAPGNYAIPKDNPFVNQKGALPEIYAYGFRNIWRMAFDKKTGNLWAADVGQNLWEEINLVQKGGNYGWSVREGAHPFGNSNASGKVIDPIWEYDHMTGKSITGGNVYRGTKVPQLSGSYLYADYISGKIWALDYDHASREVKGNYSVPSPMLPIITFGEDEQGEVYFSVVSANGRGIYKFSSDAAAVSSEQSEAVEWKQLGRVRSFLKRILK